MENYLTFKNVFYTLQDPLRITKIKPLINKYNCKELNLPSEKDNWKKMKKTMERLFCIIKRKIYSAYISKHSSNRAKKVIF